jgi:hypothetical protein
MCFFNGGCPYMLSFSSPAFRFPLPSVFVRMGELAALGTSANGSLLLAMFMPGTSCVGYIDTAMRVGRVVWT